MRSYVTGATGFIGLTLVKALPARGDAVTVLRRPTADTRWLEDLPVRQVVGDVTDPVSLHGTMRGMDRVFHVAGVAAYRRAERVRGWQVNVVGTENVLVARRAFQGALSRPATEYHARLTLPGRGAIISGDGIPGVVVGTARG
ncbi:MAG: NAD-dependent epimerase/dehydratase family protein [Chloroflexi bacterium]|nr:NAD-dependent epimerase/dehydratase family protein [Chloroflexota bacterium]